MSSVATTTRRNGHHQGGGCTEMVALTKEGRPVPTNGTKPARSPAAAGPQFDLCREEPPPASRSGRVKIEDRLEPLVKQLIGLDDGEWYRVVTWPTPSAAGQNRAKVSKAYPEFEWRSAKLGGTQSALWARYVGPTEVLP